MNLRKGTCEVGIGTGNYQPHDWRLISETWKRNGHGVPSSTLVRRWYCTRCREIESVEDAESAAHAGVTVT